MIALFVVMCAIGLGALGCLLYLVWNGLSLAVDYVGSMRERKAASWMDA